MGLIDKNYLNKINASVQKQIANQPCGCNCNCRPKFEDEGTPGPPPCNCRLTNPAFVGGYSSTAGSFQTPNIFIPELNCPNILTFQWVNLNFVNIEVTIHTATTSQVMVVNRFYDIYIAPGDYLFFTFRFTQQPFDQLLLIYCDNRTCALRYGNVGNFSCPSI